MVWVGFWLVVGLVLVGGASHPNGRGTDRKRTVGFWLVVGCVSGFAGGGAYQSPAAAGCGAVYFTVTSAAPTGPSSTIA